MNIDINGETYDIGHFLQYGQNNADTGAFQDKVKYRLCEQNNLILPALSALNSYVAELAEEIQPEPDVVYGFRIDSSESDPTAAVTYLADAVGMTPAHMDFVSGVFNWGSWENAFFMPRPCMLRYDGTVDYYLDPNDYGKKADGTASDVADFNYGGNAMMEWGRNGRKIWYKIVPDATPTSANVYVANFQADIDYKCWSFFDCNNQLIDHFYTPIYNGTIDGSGRLRSISGKAYTELCQSKTAAQEVTASELNNSSTEKNWYTEVFSDITLINLLLILIGKTLDTQTAFGQGVWGQPYDVSSLIDTGTLNDKGLFYGYNDGDHAVKVFGMENWWGNQSRRYAGHIINSYRHYIKMTRGTADGSAGTNYVTGTTAANYTSAYLNTGTNSPSTNGYLTAQTFTATGAMLPRTTGGTNATYYCDYGTFSPNLLYFTKGGYTTSQAGYVGAFSCNGYFANTPSFSIGAALSCKPEKEVQ